MNAGQILETHLGWAAKEMGRRIGELIDDYYRNLADSQAVKKLLKKTFSNNELKGVIDRLDDDEIVSLAETMRKGVNIAVPVFDSAKEEEIREFFKMAGLADSRQTTLFDGRTGDAFHITLRLGTCTS